MPEPTDTPSNVIVLHEQAPMTQTTDDMPTYDVDHNSRPSGHARQCSAKNRFGQRCRQYAIKGGTVCKSHGGSAPQVKERARLRLAALVDPAITTLAREMTGAQASRDRQSAANSILDRAGLSRGVSPEAELARALLIDRLIAMQAEQNAKR